MARKPQPDLETSLDELNTIVEKMEEGELSLDESLTHFEKGIQLTKNCQTILQKAEQKVQVLMKEHGDEELIDYDDEE